MNSNSFRSSNVFCVKGKIALVTGGGTGVGKGMTMALAINGAKVFIVGRRLDVVEDTAKEINTIASEAQMGGEVIALKGDIGTKAGVVDIYDKVSKLTDKLDYLVNNAGFSSNWRIRADDLNDPVELAEMLFSIEDSDFANMTSVHVTGPYFLGVKFIPLFQKSEDPNILNITSLASHFLNRAVCEVSYGASKAAETHLTQLMAAGLKPFGIRVNSLAPGIFKSQLTTGGKDQENEIWPLMKSQFRNIPKGRGGSWQEIAGLVLMFTSPAGAYLNGANIIVDGGWALFSSANDVD